MRETGKLDYLELPAGNSSLPDVKRFYEKAFSWSFTDYGPGYSAFNEGLDGGFDGNPENKKPLPVLYSGNLEETQRVVEAAGGKIVKPIFTFPGGAPVPFHGSCRQ